MFRSLDELRGYILNAEDGEIGRCKDFLFDERVWIVRYMVASTSRWLGGRKVIISPIALGTPDWTDKRFPVQLTCHQIESSPPLDDHEPISREYERGLFEHYGWHIYWEQMRSPSGEPLEPRLQTYTPLRSIKEVNGYTVETMDGSAGHACDFIADDTDWTIRYLVVDTRSWLPGGKVLLASGWIQRIDWADRRLVVDLTLDQVKSAPHYDPAAPINRVYEARLYDYYGRPRYWASSRSQA